MRERLLFVTTGNDHYEEGFPSAVELSGRVKKDIIILIMYGKPFMTGVRYSTADTGSSAAGGRGRPQEVPEETFRDMQKDSIKKTALLTDKYCRGRTSPKISCKTAAGDIVSCIKEVVESEPAIDMVLFGPSLGNKRAINARNILRNISKPVVFVSRP